MKQTVKSILIRKKEIFTVRHFPAIGKIVLKMLICSSFVAMIQTMVPAEL